MCAYPTGLPRGVWCPGAKGLRNACLILELCDMKFFLCPMSWEFMSRYEYMSRYKLTYYRAMI